MKPYSLPLFDDFLNNYYKVEGGMDKCPMN